MENSIFRNGRRYQSQPQHRYPVGGVPVYPFDPTRQTHQPCRAVNRPQERNSGPKVVQIPVHFVGSEEVDRRGSALKIQKVFRGFLVRKCLKKIKDIKVQVDEIGDKLSKREVMELVLRDGKERLRMNESLMSLLFKLDSICGVDLGVRGCRKAVIRKAIALQEKIDSIVNGEAVEDQERGNGQFVSMETDGSNQTPRGIIDVEGDDGEIDVIDVGVDREVKVINCVGDDDDDDNVIHVGDDDDDVDVIHEDSDRDDDDVIHVGDSDDDDVLHEGFDLAVKDGSKQGRAKEGDDDRKQNREMLERLVEGNATMMSLMTQLCERNETQTRMINALTQRVDMLEKAFLGDCRLRKKKKNNKKNKKVVILV